MEIKDLHTGLRVNWYKPGRKYPLSVMVYALNAEKQTALVIDGQNRTRSARCAELEPVKPPRASAKTAR